MRKNKFLKSTIVTTVMLAAAVGLLLFGGIGGARAALSYQSEVYTSRIVTTDIGVALLENGQEVAANGATDGKLLTNLLGEGEKFCAGKEYKEELAVSNKVSGDNPINEFVRVKVYKYWIGPNGEKDTQLDPDLIKLHFTEGNGWIIDTEQSTKERTVLYYSSLLNAGETSSLFADKLSVDGQIATKVNVVHEGNKIITTFAYDGYQIALEAEVDAVQEHNAQDAIKSAWGKNVIVNGTTLSLG